MHNTYIVKVKTDDISHAGIKGMRWGVRRYQNEDGTLTDLGKKRYASAKKDVMDESRQDAYNKAVKKHLAVHPGDSAGAKAAGRAASKSATATTKVDKDALLDDMVKKDLDSTNTVLRETSNASRTAATAVKSVRVNVPRMDLSSMTDKEMRDRIARERLEIEYDSVFNTKRHVVESGKATVAGIVEGLGTAATLASSALAIALAVKQLRS